jgi:hypothetical protein
MGKALLGLAIEDVKQCVVPVEAVDPGPALLAYLSQA